MAVAAPGDRRRPPLRLLLAAGLVVTMPVTLPPAQSLAKPKPTVKQLKKELAELQKNSDKLIAEYYSSRVELQKVEKAEKKARERLKVAQADYDRESAQLRLMATEQYMSGGLGIVPALLGEVDMAGMATLRAISEEQGARLEGFTQVRDQHREAKTDAQARADELGARIKELGAQKKDAEKVIEKIKDRIDLLYPTPGVRRPDGSWVPQLPSGPDNITPRMRLVKKLIAERFGVPYGIGCYRAIQDGGEHPMGRACDFMLSRGGAMPSAAEVKRGNEISAWVVKNAGRLGIMYVIYRQRIWHVRTGSWRVMSNRGGTTANHYDHPHISVY
ncbi:coiled-coil domain-containing protein [Nonomuraea sp. NPDC059194]|uniref:coiled-coil domain-containing protein n=1 Tax=Nonomuraea sp. NPDC059194 TaxID=3346764 RepID=UPI00368EC8BB